MKNFTKLLFLATALVACAPMASAMEKCNEENEFKKLSELKKHNRVKQRTLKKKIKLITKNLNIKLMWLIQ